VRKSDFLADTEVLLWGVEKIPSGRAEAIGKFRTTERGDHQTSIKLDLTIVISSGERYAVVKWFLVPTPIEPLYVVSKAYLL